LLEEVVVDLIYQLLVEMVVLEEEVEVLLLLGPQVQEILNQ
jgi:hypothetical protein